MLAYASNYGCAQEIAEEMAKVLEREGVKAMLLDLRSTKIRNFPTEIEFSGVIVGSGIKVNKWIKEALTFLESNVIFLKDGCMPLGLFVCSAYAVADRERARKMYLEDVAAELELSPVLYEAFPGVLDFSKESDLGFVDKRMLKLAAKGMSKDLGLEFDENGRNDFRNWDEIREFASRFAELILNQ